MAVGAGGGTTRAEHGGVEALLSQRGGGAGASSGPGEGGGGGRWGSARSSRQRAVTQRDGVS